MDELTALRRELVERAVPSKETWWGYDAIQIDDPDGNELLFPTEGNSGSWSLEECVRAAVRRQGGKAESRVGAVAESGRCYGRACISPHVMLRALAV